MNDLLKKLNVLVKSTFHDALSVNSTHQPLSPTNIGKDIGHEVGQLRQRINDALEFEDQLQKRVESLKGEIDKWDKQADDAVTAVNDVNARYAIEQMQRTQQRLAIAEADLHEHQLVTQELITRVNALDAAAADARRSANETQVKPGEASAPPSQVLTESRTKMRENLNGLSSTVEVNDVQKTSQPSVDDERVEDDLARRRQRLSKPE